MRFIYWVKGLAILFALLIVNLIILPGLVMAAAQPAVEPAFAKFYDQNERCFRCHGSSKYTYYNAVNDKDVSAMMCENRVIHREDFYTANHRSFACVDCHAAEYNAFPHPGALRMESPYACIDCHGYDEQYAKYHFEDIDAEFQQSTHFTANDDAFTCWKCHNPHSYKISIRDSKNITEAIAYDNHICLNCHSDFERFQLLTSREEINIIEKHDWLPNQGLHFSQVRCIECHARPNDSLMVAHRILPKENAVKRCVECHSQNSLLMSSLYKFQAKENRTQAGFLNAIILNNAFVIGANRNIVLNRVSIVAFLALMGGLMIHLLFRMIYKKNA